jgi:phosphatidylinositol-3-phosphatase
MRLLLTLGAVLLALAASDAGAPAAGGPTPDDLAVPRYAHVFVIMDENKSFERIDGGADAPALTRLAQTYGAATRFYGEVHPSEANYVALLGGSTFGIHDDDAYYCKPGATQASCHGAKSPGYASHTIDAPHLGTQLEAAGLSWKGYYQSIPAAGSGAVVGSDPVLDGRDARNGLLLYASKHSGFLNFASVQNDRNRAQHLVGFDVLQGDLAAGTLSNFALIIPNVCDDMHGSADPGTPADCRYENPGGLIRRGDAAAGKLVDEITASKVWRSRENAAIVITFDEDDGAGRGGCCGVTPNAPSNFGGGHIATIVITNNGPRGVEDATPYNHYSLLRTIEDAFGIHDYLGLAAASDEGVKPMLPLFRTH